MKKQLKNIILILTIFLLLCGCGIIGPILIGTSYNAKLTINNRFVKSSHGLINGIRFEKLTVIDQDENGIPTDYIVTQRFECVNTVGEGVQDYWPNKLYFNKVNGDYKWKADTVSFHFKKKGHYRERIFDNNADSTFLFQGLNDTVSRKIKGDLNEIFILNSIAFETCPVNFASQTWYYLNLYDPVIASVFLYFDSKNKYHVYKFGSGVSPI